MKTCTKCNVAQPLSEFYKCKNHKDLHTYECKTCMKKHTAAYRTANLERAQAATKKWKELNKNHLSEYRRIYYKNNHSTEINYTREYRKNNPEIVRNLLLAWKSRNPNNCRIYAQNRRTLTSKGQLSENITEKLMKLQKGKCACCGKPLNERYDLDHIIPLSKGGLHIDSNIQLLSRTCNRQKHNKDPIEFMQSRGFLL